MPYSCHMGQSSTPLSHPIIHDTLDLIVPNISPVPSPGPLLCLRGPPRVPRRSCSRDICPGTRDWATRAAPGARSRTRQVAYSGVVWRGRRGGGRENGLGIFTREGRGVLLIVGTREIRQSRRYRCAIVNGCWFCGWKATEREMVDGQVA